MAHLSAIVHNVEGVDSVVYALNIVLYINMTADLLKQSIITIKFTDMLFLPPYCGHFIRSMRNVEPH